jgi:hypothetical protein
LCITVCNELIGKREKASKNLIQLTKDMQIVTEYYSKPVTKEIEEMIAKKYNLSFLQVKETINYLYLLLGILL